MLVEMHVIQNFAPSNLNRDDTGSPKDCEFGGFRRARISSQCLKRAIRETFREHDLLPQERLAQRTKRLVEEVGGRLAQEGKDQEQAQGVIEAALASVGVGVVRDPRQPQQPPKTQYLLYLGREEIARLTRLCLDKWDDLVAATPQGPSGDGQARVSARDAKRAGRAAVPEQLSKALSASLDGGRAADLALFGRMLADLPERNIDAASQVAHALSTNQVTTEFDYYTAVDDLKPEDTAGADMIGTVEFNSACFYRYANVDIGQLRQNLGGDDELTRRTLEAFLRASIAAVPTGKQNSMAAHNPPSLVMTVTRRAGLWSLANAFVMPVRPDSSLDLVSKSIQALDSYWTKLDGMYGTANSGVSNVCVASLDGDGLSTLGKYAVPTVPDLVERTVRSAFDIEGNGAQP